MGRVMTLTLPLLPTVERSAEKLAEAVGHAECDKERVLLTRNGKPVAAVVPIEDLQALEALEAAEDEHWSDVAADATARWEAEGRPLGPTLEELAARYGIAPDPTLG